MMCGGVSQSTNPADQSIRDLLAECKPEFQTKTNLKLDRYDPICYKTQVVAGTNYFVKVEVSENVFVHARIFKGLPHQGSSVSIHSIQENKTLEDSLEYF
jgi:cystatin-A/B